MQPYNSRYCKAIDQCNKNPPVILALQIRQSETSRNIEATDQCSPKPPVILAIETNIYKEQFSNRSLVIVTLQTNATQELFLL